MTSIELAKETSLRTGYTATVCYEILREAFNVMRDSLAGYEEVKIQHFGTFSVYDRKGRNRYDNVTQTVVYQDGQKYPKFTPSPTLKKAIRS